MTFLNIDDLKSFIKSNVLDDITQSDATLLDHLEKVSTSQIKSMIGHYYDLEDEFNKTLDDRNHFIVSLVIDLLLYHLSCRLTPTQVPEMRKDRYDQAVKTLSEISSGKLVLAIARKDKKYEPSSEFRYGSNPSVNFDY